MMVCSPGMRPREELSAMLPRIKRLGNTFDRKLPHSTCSISHLYTLNSHTIGYNGIRILTELTASSGSGVAAAVLVHIRFG